MPRRRKYRQRYDYSVTYASSKTLHETLGKGSYSVSEELHYTTIDKLTASNALYFYCKDPEHNSITMTPRFGGIKRTIRPEIDRKGMLKISIHELIRIIFDSAPWTEKNNSSWEHAVENALLLNIPRSLLLEFINVDWLLDQKRDLSHELTATHRKWLTEKHAAKENRIQLSMVSCQLTTAESKNGMQRLELQKVREELEAKNRRLAELESLLDPSTW